MGRNRLLPVCLGASFGLTVGYLVVGEILPQPVATTTKIFTGAEWVLQEVLLLGALSLLGVSLAIAGGCTTFLQNDFRALLAILNIIPLIAAVASTCWSLNSGNCPAERYAGSSHEARCGYFGVFLDVLGVASARLARLDLAACLLLATRGESAWVYGATGGWLGLPETIHIHVAFGWWCVGQTILHSLSYLVFYPYTGGLNSVWYNLLPTSIGGDEMNRLGLVNFIGVVALLASLPLAVTALPTIRQRIYHTFQMLHLPLVILFVIGSALHDRPILLFALPGIADWYMGRRSTAPRRLLATAQVLRGTSGPWIELTVDCSTALGGQCSRRRWAQRGEWALVRALPLGMETHPFSVSVGVSGKMSALVAASAGDWSRGLADLARSGAGRSSASIQLEVSGPFRVGGGDWSLTEEPALLLIAGGTGIFGWLNTLTEANCQGRYVQFVWIVKTEEDYCSLADRLPPSANIQIDVFITRSSAVGNGTSEDLGSGSMMPPSAQDNLESGSTPVHNLLGDAPEASKSACDIKEYDLRCIDASSQSNATEDNDSKRCSSDIEDLCLICLSLVAVCTGLGVGYWGWYGLEEVIGEPSTLLGYFMKWRLFPVALILAATSTVMIVGCRICCIFVTSPHYEAFCAHGNKLEHCSGTQNSATTFGRDPLLSNDNGSGSMPTAAAAHESSSSKRLEGASTKEGIRVRYGRPDLHDLVGTAAATVSECLDGTIGVIGSDRGKERHQRQKNRLVIAACGPAGLVREAHRAVTATRTRSFFLGLKLVFSGTDARW